MRLKLPLTCFILEIILIILFGVLVEYDDETNAKKWHNLNHTDYDNDFYYRYPSECTVDVQRMLQEGSGIHLLTLFQFKKVDEVITFKMLSFTKL